MTTRVCRALALSSVFLFSFGAHGSSVAAATTTPITFTVGGRINGLRGTLLLQLNGGANLTLTSTNAAVSTPFTFASKLATGATFSVSVKSQPTGQVCTVNNGTGTVGRANVASVTVNCVTQFRISSPPIPIEGGEDIVWCAYFELTNEDGDAIRSIHSSLPNFVDNISLWAETPAGEKAGTVVNQSCGPNADLSALPIYVTRKSADGSDHTLTFPSDDGTGRPLGYLMKRHQTIAMQMHWINPDPPGGLPRVAHINVDITTYTPGTTVTPVSVYRIFSNEVNVPPGGPTTPSTAHVQDQCPTSAPGGEQMKFIDMTMITHRHGTHTAITDGSTIVNQDSGASSPVTRQFTSPPFFTFKTGTLGYQCDYTNHEDQSFRTDDDDSAGEACMMVAHVFSPSLVPDQGRLCVDRFIFN